MAKKNSLVTPKGTLMYAFVARPDKKYKKEHGEFRIQQVLPLNDTNRAIAAAVEERITSNAAEKKAAKLKEDPKFKGKIKISPDRPYEINEEEGTIMLKFKRGAVYKDKDTGAVVQVTIPVFEANGVPMSKERIQKLGNGSEGQVSYLLQDYVVDGKGIGVKFSLNAVQVSKYVEYTGGNAESYGFDVESSDDDSGGTTEAATDTTTAEGDEEEGDESDF